MTPAILTEVRARPEVTGAEARAVIDMRARVGDGWTQLLLFVVDDFATMRLNTFAAESGAWPPPTGSMLIERQAQDVLGAKQGGTLTLRTPSGHERAVDVVGVVHDTTLAPAWQEQAGYGYITKATLAVLGEPPILDELRVTFAGGPGAFDAKAVALATDLQRQGEHVHAVKVPPPRQHPHQGQILASLRGFLNLASLALLLATILVAAVLNAILARQVREIGIMKAIGARGRQIAALYVAQLLALGVISLAIGLPAGAHAAGWLATRMADSMNFAVTDQALPAWCYAVLLSAGALLPLLVSAPTLTAAARMSVREALSSFGVPDNFGGRRLDRLLARLRGLSASTLLGLRNVFRRRGRLAVSLALLGTGGGLFITSLSVRAGWRAMAGHVVSDRFYDAAFLLRNDVPIERIAQALAPVTGIRELEVWRSSASAFARDAGAGFSRAHPARRTANEGSPSSAQARRTRTDLAAPRPWRLLHA